MIVTVFRSRLMPGLQEEYVALVERVRQEVEKMPGYISHKGFWADDGERFTIVEFENEEAQRAWRMNKTHIEAQRLGRQKYYATYDIQVFNVLHESHFKRGEPGEAAAG
jgi:heme-degrading monooxygenase HmoA